MSARASTANGEKKGTSLLTRSRSLGVPLMGATGTFGKDVLRGARIPFSIATLLLVIWVSLTIIELAFPGGSSKTPDPTSFFQLFLPLVAYLLGVTLTGEEEETDTRFFLDRLPAARLGLMGAKLAAGIVTWMVGSIALTLVWSALVMETPASFLRMTLKQFGSPDQAPLAAWLASPQGALLCLTLFLSGFAIGALVRRNLVLATLVGYVVTALLLGGLDTLFTLLGMSERGMANGAMPGAHRWFAFELTNSPMLTLGLWCGWCLVVSGWRFHARREIEESRWMRLFVREAPDSGVALASAIAMAHRGTRVWGLCLAIAMAVAGALVGWRFDPVESFYTCALVGGLGTLAYGILAHTGEETDRRTFFLHTLPIDGGCFLRQRLWRLAAWGALCMAGAMISGTIMAVQWTSTPRSEIDILGLRDATSLEAAVRFVPWMLLLGAALAWLGYFVRGFFRPALVALVMGVPLLAAWLLAWSIVAVAAEWLLPWTAFVSLVLAGGAVWIAERHSLLGEMNDGVRGLAFLPLCFALSVWGVFVMTLWPLDVLRIIF